MRLFGGVLLSLSFLLVIFKVEAGDLKKNNVPTVHAEEIHKTLTNLNIIDVRRADEFNNELAHIPGAKLMTLETELKTKLNALDKKQKIIFVCRSGRRSAEATKLALSMGFTSVFNLEGGMIRWNELKLPTTKDN